MNLFAPFVTQRTALRRVVFVYAIAMVIMLIVYAQPYVKISELTRDAVVVAKGMFYYGLISNLGILLWCATATVCLFTATLQGMWGIKVHRSFLLFGGLLTTLLLLDDFLMLHEEAIPKFLSIGEKYVMGLYMVLILSFLTYFLKDILDSRYLVLMSALGFFGLSVFTDLLSKRGTSEIECLIEDGFKLLGIAGWFFYFCSTSISILKRGIANKLRSSTLASDKKLYKKPALAAPLKQS